MEHNLKVRDPVVLRDQARRRYPSRVEDLGSGLVVVAQPHALPDEESFDNGTELSVLWAESEDAVAVLPTRLLVAHGEAEAPLWSLLVTGPATLEQRRRVERVEVSGPVALRPPGDTGGGATGDLVDISEKALRCSVATGSADAFLGDRNQVVAAFAIGGVDFTVPGRVESARATKQPTRFEDLVVMFDEPVEHAERLRKQIFAQEAQPPAE